MTQFLWIHAVAMRVCMFHIQIYVNMKHINCRTPLALSISGNPTFAECKKTLNALGIMSNLPSGGYIGLCKQSFLCRRRIFFFCRESIQHTIKSLPSVRQIAVCCLNRGRVRYAEGGNLCRVPEAFGKAPVFVVLNL